MNTNVSEELVNNDSLLNWIIDRTNNVSPDSISYYERVEHVYVRGYMRELPQQPVSIPSHVLGYMPQRPEPRQRYFAPQGPIRLSAPLQPIRLSIFYELPRTDGKFDISIVIEESKKGESESEEFDCSICFELSKAESKIALNCGHSFCGQCIKKTLTSCNGRTPTCALCRTNVSSFKVPNKEIHDLVAPHCNNVV